MMLAALILLICLGMATATNPGVQGRITEKGINYANSVAQASLAEQLKTLKIPDQSGKDGHISWEFKNIQNRGVTPPKSRISLDPGKHGLSWALTGLGIKLYADWRIKYKKGWMKASTSGSVDVGVNGANVQVTISLGADSTGRPSLKTASCSSSIGGVDLDFHGGTGWLINLFRHPLENKVKDILQKQICTVVTKQINENGNKAMAKLKVEVPIAKKFVLDYRLIAAPVVTSSYLEIQDKGEVFWMGDKKEAPFQPEPIPASKDNSRMFYLWITQYTANTFGYAGQNHNYLQYNISKDDLPGTNSSYLNTTCKLMCIGKVIPEIGKKYPNQQVSLHVSSTSAPKVKIEPKGVTLAMKANIDLYADAPGKQPTYLLTLNMTLSLSMNAAIEKERLVGKITGDSFQFGVAKSAIGKINVLTLNLVLKGVMALVVIPELNKVAAAGVDLPITGEVKFTNTKLQLLQGSIMVATDLTYTPQGRHGGTYSTDMLLSKMDEEPTFRVVGSKF